MKINIEGADNIYQKIPLAIIISPLIIIAIIILAALSPILIPLHFGLRYKGYNGFCFVITEHETKTTYIGFSTAIFKKRK